MTIAAYIAFEPEDAALATALASALQQAGLSVRLADPELRRPEAVAALAQAVSEARCVVAIVSPASDRSEWVRREAVHALNNGRPIVPVRVADVPAESWMRLAIDQASVFDAAGGLTPTLVAEIAEAVRAANAAGRVIAMLNIKGGVGKTVLAANLFAAAHLVDNRSVAFIDLDPQHNLTQYFLPPEERHRLQDEGRTIYAVYASRGAEAIPKDGFLSLTVPVNRRRPGAHAAFDLVAGDDRLFEFTLDTRSDRDKSAAFTRFQALITTLRARYDLVIIDVNPCATFLTRCAITAADHIVAPVRPEKYSLTGLNMLEHVVREIRGRPLRPSEFSVILNGVGDRVRSRMAGDVDALTRAEIREAPFFGSALIGPAIPYSGALRATPSDRYAANPINVTALMRVAQRDVKESLAAAAAEILKRAGV